MKRYDTILFALLIFVSSFFFKDFFLQGMLPIPSDTIVGLYHPYRDFYAKDYPNGIPYKNFLITDPVRQQYPWRNLAVEKLKNLEVPIWNPYSIAGYPLLGNMQSASFYPLNVIYILPFATAWSIQVFLQLLLAGVFLYWYLTYLKIDKWAAFLGSIAFSFSGFFIAWLEWNTILHVALWLPLILLAKEHLLKRVTAFWVLVFIFAACAQIFAGHLQTFFYSFLISNVYLLVRTFQIVKEEKEGGLFLSAVKKYYPFLLSGAAVFVITAVQWFPTIQLIFQSAREVDQANWQKEGWFIPWQHLLQFIAPDFFGNPTTLNYWGVWNYAEFIGFVGIVPFIMGLYALFFRRDKKTFFFGTLFFLSVIFATPTIFAKLPYILNIPLLSSSQPTRLLFVTVFSLSVLAALGFDLYLRTKNKIIYPVLFIGFILFSCWLLIFIPTFNIFGISPENLQVIKRNLYFPSAVFLLSSGTIMITTIVKNKNFILLGAYLLLCITVLDLFRFADKFTPFTNPEYLFPHTKSLIYLQEHTGNYRVMATDSRIFPPNFSVMYKIQSIDGYDPLYMRRYGELIAASESNKGVVIDNLSFNRIITPHNVESKIIDLLGVKYILSLNELQAGKLKKVYQEGETTIYENLEVMPRAYFVSEIMQFPGENKKDALSLLFDDSFDLRKKAVVEGVTGEIQDRYSEGKAQIVEYDENKVVVKTTTNGDGFLVLTDTFYANWHAKIFRRDKTFVHESKIYRTNYNFRGIIVPEGEHIVEFYASLF